MAEDLRFIGWKAAELLVYLAGFPFLFVGSWMEYASNWCRRRADRVRAHQN